MEPLPATVDALRELTRLGDAGTAGALRAMSREVEQIVPDILALSLTLTHEHLTFTMTSATSRGITSTLSLPIVHNGVVTAEVDLYAPTPNAFEGRHDALARACGAEAERAVTDEDLTFRTRLEAVQTPERIRSGDLIDQAVGALMSRSGVELDEAEESLRQAAERAGLSEARMARAILTLFHASCGPDPDALS